MYYGIFFHKLLFLQVFSDLNTGYHCRTQLVFVCRVTEPSSQASQCSLIWIKKAQQEANLITAYGR